MQYLITALAFIVGLTFGWLAAERYIAFMQHTEHEHENSLKEPTPRTL
jgi:hypothetical protein